MAVSQPIFNALWPEQPEALAALAVTRHLQAGETVFKEGESGDGLYLIESGQVEISGQMLGQGHRVFCRLGPGELFGEMAVIENHNRSASAAATEPSVLHFLERDAMLELIQRTPGLAMRLLQLISHRLRDFNRVFLDEIVQAERLAVIGQFARSIIHDLKNPLQIISLNAELIATPGLPADLTAQAPGQIRAQVERINDLVAQILEFTQGGASRPQALDYRQFLLDTLAQLRPSLDLKQIEVTIAGELPEASLQADPRRLRRVLANLTGNAGDAMEGGGQLRLRVEQRGHELLTELQDSGPGIAEPVLEKLFQPFTTHGKSHGTGLGLSICRQIIEEHGGHISARNAAEGGAIFAFTLPLQTGSP